ncbi:helix-turn-helix domain-containing protein [Paracoccus xiamenensis]|uniref:helix-turn-helix domain-containing protein n=1 Tax=Paracoccus xiamenensis TaxID=2714901 RepID=UPI00140A71C0|nr:AraC family transcriptional regulator [Paracoccus xiamenensis]NHF74508.1 helix-turn-helix transcriptional regulator [Paracoccus xiamenensis]
MGLTIFHRVRRLVGTAPLTDLTEWPMRLAERVLRDDRTPVATITRSLSYSSESAFSNAFKPINGNFPTAYRRVVRAEPEGAT